MMKSDIAIKTFVTFRVAGDNLAPDDISRILKIQPTHSHLKDEKYSTGISKDIVGSTGVWLLDTDKLMYSHSLHDHLEFVLVVVGLWALFTRSGDQSDQLDNFSKILKLKTILEQKSLSATMTLFWHGAAGSTAPKLPESLVEVLKLIPINVEPDFDKDEELKPSSRRSKAA